MWNRPLNGAWGRLSQHIGPGRGIENQGIQMTLTMECQGGVGLIWPLKVAGQPCRAWCDAGAWCQWIEPMLSVPAFEAIDQALLPALALWSWSVAPPFNAGEAGSAVQVSAPALGSVACEWDPVLTLMRDQSSLVLRLLDWSYDWLLEQSSAWPALQPERQKKGPCVAVSLALGWYMLPGHALKALHVGEGLLLQSSVDIKRNQAWLFYQQPLAQLKFSTPQQAVIEATMAEIEQTPFEAAGSDQIPLTLVVEIGQWMVPLAALAHLEIGQIIEGEAAFDGVVRLKINGCTLGYATLVQMGESWVARIDQLAAQWSGTAAADSQGALLVESVSLPAVTDKIEEESNQGEPGLEVAMQAIEDDQTTDSVPAIKVSALEEDPAIDIAVDSHHADLAAEQPLADNEHLTQHRSEKSSQAQSKPARPAAPRGKKKGPALAELPVPNKSTEPGVKDALPVSAITQDQAVEQPLADNERLTQHRSEKSPQAQSKPARPAAPRSKKRAPALAELPVPSIATAEQGDGSESVAEHSPQQEPPTNTRPRVLPRVKKEVEAVHDQAPAKAKTLPRPLRVARKKVTVKAPPNGVMS